MTDNSNGKLMHVGVYDYADESLQKGYAEMIHCNNCKWFRTVYIPKGEKIKDYLKDKYCERCNCIGVLY